MILLIIIAAVTLIVAYCAKQWYTVWQYSEQFPGQPTLPIIGNGHLLGNTSHDYMQYMYGETIRNNFQAFRMWLGQQLYIILTSAEDIEIFLSSNKYLDKFEDYRFFEDWIGQGLITVNGPNWFRNRRLITPTFHFKILNEFHDVMNSGTNRLIERFYQYADSGETFDVHTLVNLATLDVICETAMGVQVNAIDNPESDIVQAFHDVSFVVYQRIFSPWKRYNLLFPYSKEYQINKKALHILHSFNDEVIQKRRKLLLENQGKPEAENDGDGPKRKKAFLDIMLTASENGVQLSDREISEEVSTFVFAGHDTTAAGISFGMYNLAINPKEQQKVYEEQLSIFGDDINRDPTYQELQDMKYTEMFVKESQRISTSVGFIGRSAPENIQLKSGKIIPKGASVGIFLYAMGHNPKVYENPKVFNPDRFLTDTRQQKNPFEFIPFSAGPRNCVGQKFATNELRLVLAKLVRHFEILPSKEPFEMKLGVTSTVRSANGIRMRLKRRPEAAKK